MTIPHQPKSSKQNYRLSEKGIKFLERDHSNMKIWIQSLSLANESKTIRDSAKTKDDYQWAAQKEGPALRIRESVKSEKLIIIGSLFTT